MNVEVKKLRAKDFYRQLPEYEKKRFIDENDFIQMVMDEKRKTEIFMLGQPLEKLNAFVKSIHTTAYD